MTDKTLVAAVDLGSNSFRLIIGQSGFGPAGSRLKTIDSVKRSVRLAAGLDAQMRLDAASQRRALEALAVFAERLRSYKPDAVRAVATNTLRIAQNARRFIGNAEAVLGVPIEVISGHEEARLIYRGAAQALPDDGHQRLVIDIGGGSTECIIGRGHDALLLESIDQGCVAATRDHFPDEGPINARQFERARHHAETAFAAIADRYREAGWRYAVGTSGTAKALIQIAAEHFGADGLDQPTLSRMVQALVAQDPMTLSWAGLKPERRPVLAGGLAVLAGAFDAFCLSTLDYCPGALRQGVLLELLDRRAGLDSRSLTVERLCARYQVDQRYGQALANLALSLFDQAARAHREALSAQRQLLAWACHLSEVGLSISHHHHHRHSAYILEQGDLPGFSQDEQQQLALLALAQSGGLRKLRGRVQDELGWIAVLALRLACLLMRARSMGETPMVALFFRRKAIRLELPGAWCRQHPAAADAIADEARLWVEAGIVERFDYVDI